MGSVFLDTKTGRPYEWDGRAVWLNGELVGIARDETEARKIAEQHAEDVDLLRPPPAKRPPGIGPA